MISNNEVVRLIERYNAGEFNCFAKPTDEVHAILVRVFSHALHTGKELRGVNVAEQLSQPGCEILFSYGARKIFKPAIGPYSFEHPDPTSIYTIPYHFTVYRFPAFPNTLFMESNGLVTLIEASNE